MPRGIRLNVVSPILLDVSEEKYGKFFKVMNEYYQNALDWLLP